MSELPTCFMDVPLRFWAKIEVDHGSGCWLWTARRSTDGYGQVVFARQNRPAHRVCYEALRGRIEPQAGGRIVLDHRHAKKSGRVLDVQTVADERYRAITEQGTTA